MHTEDYLRLYFNILDQTKKQLRILMDAYEAEFILFANTSVERYCA